MGIDDGLLLGFDDGSTDGVTLENELGLADGGRDGAALGPDVGESEGIPLNDGTALGFTDSVGPEMGRHFETLIDSSPPVSCRACCGS